MPGDTYKVLLTIADDVDAGDTVDVAWNAYSGAIDYDNPLNKSRVDLFPGAVRQRGYGVHPYGVGCLDGRAARSGTYGEQIYGVDPYGVPPIRVEILAPLPRGFGIAEFGVRIYGPTGNTVGDDFEFTAAVGTESPLPVTSFERDSYDDSNDAITWTFEIATE